MLDVVRDANALKPSTRKGSETLLFSVSEVIADITDSAWTEKTLASQPWDFNSNINTFGPKKKKIAFFLAC